MSLADATAAACHLPVWSRGIAYRCCDLAPSSFGVFPRPRLLSPLTHNTISLGENGDLDWRTATLPTHGVVYVPTDDFANFLSRFSALPSEARLTIVTGQEDCSVPRELWEGTTGNASSEAGRYALACSAQGVANPQPLGRDANIGPLSQFLADRRLLGWWTQNYDLTGCSPYVAGCAGVAGLPPSAASKVRPLPIGLDLHTRAIRGEASVCEQWSELRAARHSAPPFAGRALKLLVNFGCAPDAVAIRYDRRAACAALQPPPRDAAADATPLRSHEARVNSTARSDFWRAVGEAAFVAAPQGHGMDTHRVWEVLALGAVPVVLSSSLDALYAPLPVVSVRAWSELAGDDEQLGAKLRAWRSDIVARFGEAPDQHEAVAQQLSLDWWARRIRQTHDVDAAAAAAEADAAKAAHSEAADVAAAGDAGRAERRAQRAHRLSRASKLEASASSAD